ncbi:zinc ribbon domain-containing protein (plasmid) [Haloarcula salina]|uniref:zinc ribbon domain-containing protein n=1 Tax=Haloarcula salina TaxID=1429914 RepID=UPI003C70404E
MENSNEGPTPPDDLSEELIQRIDALELPELKSLLSYIDQRINALRTSIEEEIEANAAGEILAIENHGAYAIVEKHPPDPDGDGVNTEITSLYHVQREAQPDGLESLHWAYLGDVHNSAQTRCESCGRTLADDVDTCPHCGSDDIAHSDTEE